MPTPQEVTAFLEVYNTLSFTKAAANLFLSQQSCSRYIRNLEDKIGFPLFVRNTRCVVPTPEGELLYQVFAEAKHNYKTAIQLGQARTGEHFSKIRAGIMHGINLSPLSRQYMDFLAQNPLVHITWSFAEPPQLKSLLQEDMIDLAITHLNREDTDIDLNQDKTYQTIQLFKTRVYLKFSPNHPLAATAKTPKDFHSAVISSLHHHNTKAQDDIFRAKRRLEQYGLADSIIRLFESIEEADASILLGETVGIISEHTTTAQLFGLNSMYLGDGDPLMCIWKRDTSNSFVPLFINSLTTPC